MNDYPKKTKKKYLVLINNGYYLKENGHYSYDVQEAKRFSSRGNAEGAANKIFLESGMSNSLEPWKENVQVVEIEE